jgi:hypothetical protein
MKQYTSCFATVSFIRPVLLVEEASNKSIKHSEDFDKKKIKREYLDRIIDNVKKKFMNSHVYILFSSTVMCGFYFSSTVA